MKFFNVIILVLTCIYLFAGCGEKNEELNLNFTDEVIADSVLLENPDGKAVVKICHQKIAPNVSIKYKDLNKRIDDFVASVMVNYGEDSQNQSEINNLLDKFLISYEEFHDEFSEAPQEWEIRSNGKISVWGNYISQRFDSYYFTGGAHPNTVTMFLNLDVLTGKEITLLDIVKNDKLRELSSLCEKKFREQKNLSPQESLTEAGFWFEGDKFFLPDNFGFTTTSLIFYYNNYEIAPYVMGATEIEVKFSEIRAMLK